MQMMLLLFMYYNLVKDKANLDNDKLILEKDDNRQVFVFCIIVTKFFCAIILHVTQQP